MVLYAYSQGGNSMQQLTGCKKKDKRTLSSRLTNLRPAKRKACMKYIPAAYSLKSKFPPVYCQHWGDCTANAACGCDDMIYHNNPERWIPSTVFTYYNSKASDHDLKDDDGSNVETALKMIKKFGVCSAKIWPNDTQWNEKPSAEAYENGLRGKEVKKWYELKNMKQMKQALFSGYPVAAAVAWAFKEYDSNFIMNSPTDREINNAPSGHAIVIVGYDDAAKLVEFRNSWSDQWANGGYAYMTYETFRRVIWWDDTYAVMK